MNGPRNSILETVGRTPVVRINKLAPAGIDLYAKLEAFNPLGSVKDRLALGIVEAAERSGAYPAARHGTGAGGSAESACVQVGVDGA